MTVSDEEYQQVEVPGPVASDAFRKEVQRLIDAYLATCMGSTKLDPDNRPNSTFGSGDVHNVKWTLTQAPTPDYNGFDGSFPADLSYGESGKARVTYESDESYGFGAPDWQAQDEEVDLYLSSITVTEDGDGLRVTVSE